MHTVLLVPETQPGIAGPSPYNEALRDALEPLGHRAEIVALAGTLPLADTAAVASARAIWSSLPSDCVPVIDGLCLAAFGDDMLHARRGVGLIHHLTGLPPGSTDSERDMMRHIECARLADLAIVVTTNATTADRLVTDFGVAADRVRIVVPGVADAPRSARAADPLCRILSVGALVPRKGHDDLIRALARLFDLNWHLTIAGDAGRDPDHAAALAQLIQETGLAARVTLAGNVSQSASNDLWRDARIFALASRHEGYGVGVAEALRRGIPVAVTAGGAAAALVTPECGIVCQPGEVDQLSKALRRMIFDTTLRHEMADAAWTVGRSLPTWREQAQKFAAAIAP